MTRRLLTIFTTVLAVLALGGAVSIAANTKGGASNKNAACLDARPGNGYGSKNTPHTGPPGRSDSQSCGNGPKK